MKKNLFIILVLLGTVLSFNSCKKGENDPFLSLSSRKARLTGEWKLTAGEWTTTTVQDQYNYETGEYEPVTTVYTYVLADDKMSVTVKYGTSPAVTSSEGYTEDLSILKDGTYKMKIVTTETEDGKNYVTTEVEEGNWTFIGGNSEQEIANKERVGFTTAKYSQTDPDGDVYTSTTSGKSSDVGVQCLDKLAKKEMIFAIDYSYKSGDSWENKSVGTKTYTLQ